ncbi:MAG: ATP-binding cassette domain-containing protein [Methylacidiphilales bacterium]|nr:ATP-binding cassette domain-containing protein [Candidatus Methylacidiphilales bacterium]MDW8349005.1 ATP-binding cassette domain-containing protein [Verrucomicrobiae bacterium]
MLEVRGLSVFLRDGEVSLLKQVHLSWPRKHLGAILGPSGCGKTTLLKTLAGILDYEEGEILWQGKDVKVCDIPLGDLGYVPQFSMARDVLTVEENLELTLSLRCGGLSSEERRDRVDRVLEEVGLREIRDREVRVLSGGQRRRLGLALELLSDPPLILCDEVTSGLDPRSEDEIVRLLWRLAHEEERLVLSVTHSLEHLEFYDSVTLLHGGYVVFQGHPASLLNYLSVEHAEQIYSRLNDATPQEWGRYWKASRESYAHELGEPCPNRMSETLGEIEPSKLEKANDEKQYEQEGSGKEPTGDGVPGVVAQIWILTRWRWRLFFRDRGTLGLQVLILISFPALVVLFAWDGLPQIQNMSMERSESFFVELKERLNFTVQGMKVGSLVSGLVMFQVILLALMASNNGAREVAAERLLYEKDRLSGMSPTAYGVSKFMFLGLLTAVQSAWMAGFVKWVCGFPGEVGEQTLILWALNFSVTMTCLAISSWARSPERASLTALYVVGFQLPLSGAVLALPEWLESYVQPFVAAYWGWSGYLQTLQATRFYDLVVMVSQTELSPWMHCMWVLMCHGLISAVAVWMGLQQCMWE